jgi:isopenicillin N synthase-like dioxygenase
MSEANENWDFSPRSFREMAWYSEADAPPGVPILDLASMCDLNSRKQTSRSFEALGDAVRNSGFLYIKNHGIEETEIESLANATRQFFGESERYKAQFDGGDRIRGYSSYRAESTARFFGTSKGKDLCMKYTMGPELTSEEVQARITSATDVTSNAYSENIFPNPVFRKRWIDYYAQIHRVSCELLNLLSSALDLTDEHREIWREMLVERSCGELRFLQYPDVPAAACAGISTNVDDRMAAHFDMDVITLLHQTPCDNGFVSLEAKGPEGYFKVPAIRGTIVVNLGEIIRLLTGGLVHATVHRVARPPLELQQGSARDVTVFFQAPPLNAQLRPIPFEGSVGAETIFDDFYKLAGKGGVVSFSSLRTRLFEEFSRQTRSPDDDHERDAALFAAPADAAA